MLTVHPLLLDFFWLPLEVLVEPPVVVFWVTT